MEHKPWSYEPEYDDENCIAQRKEFRKRQQKINIEIMDKYKRVSFIMRVYRSGTNEIGVLIVTMDENVRFPEIEKAYEPYPVFYECDILVRY